MCDFTILNSAKKVAPTMSMVCKKSGYHPRGGNLWQNFAKKVVF